MSSEWLVLAVVFCLLRNSNLAKVKLFGWEEKMKGRIADKVLDIFAGSRRWQVLIPPIERFRAHLDTEKTYYRSG
jgi:hypothetical protein